MELVTQNFGGNIKIQKKNRLIDLYKKIKLIKKNKSYVNKEKIMNQIITYDTSYISNYWEKNNITDYDNMNVIYLGVIGIYNNGLLIKYGMSSYIQNRIKDHNKTFGEQFKIIYCSKCDNNNIVEKLFEQIVRSKKISVELEFGNKNQTELFTTNNEFKVSNAIEIINKLIEENPLKVIEEKDNKIKELEDNNLLLIEQEKTKQMELTLKIKKCELELLNY